MNIKERPKRLELEENIVVSVESCAADPLLTNAQLAARTIDISASGMKVWLYVPLPKSTRLSLKMPGQGNLRLNGEVRWAEGADDVRAGVRIDEQSDDFSAWCKKFTSELTDEDA